MQRTKKYRYSRRVRQYVPGFQTRSLLVQRHT